MNGIVVYDQVHMHKQRFYEDIIDREFEDA